MCWGQHSAAYLLRCVKDHIHQEMHMEVSGFREELHFKLKRYIHVVRAEGFLYPYFRSWMVACAT